jgi:hypothetical protein
VPVQSPRVLGFTIYNTKQFTILFMHRSQQIKQLSFVNTQQQLVPQNQNQNQTMDRNEVI